LREPLKQQLPQYEAVSVAVQSALTPQRLPLLIAIDGADGVGKTSLASWLAWQLGMPAIHLDCYLEEGRPIRFKTPEFARVVESRLGNGRPALVEGILVIDALEQIGKKADFLIFVSGSVSKVFASELAEYRNRTQPEERADFVIEGFVD
jgi:hypothetical protein